MRKWQYIAKSLEFKNAPTKIINAAKEIDNILVELGLGWDTYMWSFYEMRHNYEDESWDHIREIVNNTNFCPACVACSNRCENCILGDEQRCTPRDNFADNYFLMVTHYICNIYNNCELIGGEWVKLG